MTKDDHEVLEIKIYGSGGQGAVVAAKLLTEAAVKSGYMAQSFSSYGALRRGGKVESYVRISKGKIFIHSKMYKPNCVVVLDENLAKAPEIVLGLEHGTKILINSRELADAFSLLRGFDVITVDADRIAFDNGITLPTGMPMINTTILGALLGLIGEVGFEHLADAIREAEVPGPERNIDAAKEAYLSIRSQLAGDVLTRGNTDIAKIYFEQRYPTYSSKKAPCAANCPAGEEIQTTISLIHNNRFEEALENIKAENPFPGVCGRVCYHPCSSHCNRNDFDEAVATNALERAAFDYADNGILRKPLRKKETGKRVAIIGSGPAGMTCAYFSAILGHRVDLFESSQVLGGIPRTGIPEYRLPRYVVDKEIRQIIELGINVRTNTEVGKDINFEKIIAEYDACFVGVGAHGSVRLGIPGENSQGVISGLDFLKKVDGGERVYLGKKVAVVGGGNTAVDAARTAKRLGVTDVSIIYRRSAAEMPAYRSEVEDAEKEGIEIFYLTMPIQIYCKQNVVERLECIKMKLGGKDSDGRRQPEPVEGTNFAIDVNTVVVAVGETPIVPFQIKTVQMDGRLIKVDYLGRTSVAGIYAGGDATTLSRSIVGAIASGKRAALGIDVFLQGDHNSEIVKFMASPQSAVVSMKKYLVGETNFENGGTVLFKDLNTAYFSSSAQTKMGRLSIGRNVRKFSEVNLGLTREQAVKEADRCFCCGKCNLCENCYTFCPDLAISFNDAISRFSIDKSLCKECGICIEECPPNAIIWETNAQ